MDKLFNILCVFGKLEESAQVMFCLVGIIYALILTAWFYLEGLRRLFWPIVLMIGFLVIVTTHDPNWLNSEHIPKWIFHRICLIAAPLEAAFITVIIHKAQIEKDDY